MSMRDLNLRPMQTPLDIRPPAVAGAFYAGSREQLTRDVQDLLRGAQPTAADEALPKALIAPHAGYMYSGAIAANAYARFASARGRTKRVVLLGPAHRVAIEGLALPGVPGAGGLLEGVGLPGVRGLETPLGIVSVDQAAVRAISDHVGAVESSPPH